MFLVFTVVRTFFSDNAICYFSLFSVLSSCCWLFFYYQRQDLKGEQIKRNAFTLCVIHRSINAALIDYKKRMCGTNVTNYEKTYNVLAKG